MSLNPRSRKFISVALKIFAVLLLLPFALLLLLFLLLRVPQVREFAGRRVSALASNALDTKVQVDRLDLVFPLHLELQNGFVLDRQNDTLLSFGQVKVSLSLKDLFSQRISITSAHLGGGRIHAYRNKGREDFNYEALFASDKQETSADTSASSWQIKLSEVRLSDCAVRYADIPGGVSLAFSLRSADAAFSEFDLINSRILLQSLVTDGIRCSLDLSASTLPDTSSSTGESFDFDTRSVKLHDTQFRMHDTTSGISLSVVSRDLYVNARRLDLIHERIDADRVLISGTDVRITQRAQTPDPVAAGELPPDSVSSGAGWIIGLASLSIDSTDVQIHDNGKPLTAAAFDPAHLRFSGIRIAAKDLLYSEDSIAARVSDLAVVSGEKVTLKKLQGDFSLGKHTASAKNAQIVTTASNVKVDVSARYPSLSAGLKEFNVGSLYLQARVGATDILLFDPALDTILSNPHTIIRLDAQASGSIEQIRLDKLRFATGEGIKLSCNGTVLNAGDSTRSVTLSDIDLQYSRAELVNELSSRIIPASIVLRDAAVRGEAAYSSKKANAALAISSSAGDITAAIHHDGEKFNGKINTVDLVPSRIVSTAPDVGPITMQATAEGTGSTAATLNGKFEVLVGSARFNGYNYRNAVARGTVVNGLLDGSISMRDVNLAIDAFCKMQLDASHIRANVNLSGADLAALRFVKNDLRVAGTLTADIRPGVAGIPEGTITLRHVQVARKEASFTFDSARVVSSISEGTRTISLSSDFADAEVTGVFEPEALGTAVQEILRSHVVKQSASAIPPGQKLALRVSYRTSSLPSLGLVEGLEKLAPFTITGSLDSDQRLLKADGVIPQVKYRDILLDSLDLSVNADKESLRASVKIAELSNPDLKLENFAFNGKAAGGNGDLDLSVKRDNGDQLLECAALLRSEGDDAVFTLKPALTLNAEKWRVDSMNTIRVGAGGAAFRRFALSGNGQTLTLNNKEDHAASPLDIVFTNFNAGNISRLIENNSELIGGVMNGSLTLEKSGGELAFRSDISIAALVFRGIPVGDISLNADNYEEPGRYDLALKLTGNGNDMSLTGNFKPAVRQVSFSLDIAKLDLHAVEPFTFGSVTGMSGNLHAKLKITGSTDKPTINGKLELANAGFRPALLETPLMAPAGTIIFEGHKVKFSKFAVYDSLKQEAIVDGHVELINLPAMPLDLRVRTNNFLALNTTKADNPLYHGTVFLDSDIRLKGTPDQPRIDLKAKLNKGSSVTYVQQQSGATVKASKGIVEFTDSLPPGSDIMTRSGRDSAGGVTKGIDLHAALSFDRTVKLKMVVDPISGDSLFVVGGGNLDFTLNREGSMALTGRYRINDGGYYMTINKVVKRNFQIERGSSVTWSGDPLDAYLDIKAIYKIKTSPIDLVQEELEAMSELERNKYRNLLTFHVYLKMIGMMTSPEVSFDIQLAPSDRGALNGAVNSKLARLGEDESQLNKQVFALLTLKRFVGDNPLQSSGGGGFASASRSSASSLLTNQLNALSGRYVNFVDLDLGVNSFEDYSSGKEEGRTQLQVGVSKKLLDDRITVRVGGNVELEGERSRQNNASDVAGNISIDYNLTEDGRYKARAFRENQYENPIEGELTRTGAGIIYTRNFNKFRDLFRKPRKRTNRDRQDDQK